MYKQFFITSFFVLCVWGGLLAVPAESYLYVQRDTSSLYLDLYRPEQHRAGRPTVVYFYGGGFIRGSRLQEWNRNYCLALQQQGYTVVAVDYRLGLVGVGKMTPKKIEQAIMMATADGMSAVAYLCNHAEAFGINLNQLYLAGSSAGAITVLQMDYMWDNGEDFGAGVPVDLRFAGVVSYAGGVFSHEGRPDYRQHSPAPTLFLHGTDDYVVPYKSVRVFCRGMFGTDKLVKQFKKHRYPFYVRRYENLGHQVASFYPITIPLLNYFVTVYGQDRAVLQIDELYWDESTPPMGNGRKARRELSQEVKASQ